MREKVIKWRMLMKAMKDVFNQKKDLNDDEKELLRMDSVGIVVESLDNAISFFSERGLKLEGQGTKTR
jgi:hypothetical protein